MLDLKVNLKVSSAMFLELLNKLYLSIRIAVGHLAFKIAPYFKFSLNIHLFFLNNIIKTSIFTSIFTDRKDENRL